MSSTTFDAAERAARECYGKLLSWLAWQWRDVCAAEDALSGAFESALTHWPKTGVPISPEAWLLAAAKRNMLLHARRIRKSEDPRAVTMLSELVFHPESVEAIPDYRLRLLLVCTHPAIDKSIHAALMLQTVFGIDAARIASVFLVNPSTLSKRLVRAKSKIRDARISFAEPDETDLRLRVDSVIEAIYALYTLNGHLDAGACEDDLTGEAVYLAQLLCLDLCNVPEVQGFYALLLFIEARKNSRINAQGIYVPLDEQDPAHWNPRLMAIAETALGHAVSMRSTGRYQLEAAIQSAHMSAIIDGVPHWREITQLYENLLLISDTIGARIGYAIALSRSTGNVTAGIEILDSIDPSRVQSHQPFWAARAALLARAGLIELAKEAYCKATAMGSDEATKRWLTVQASKL